MENHHFQWEHQRKIAMFNSFLYVYQRVATWPREISCCQGTDDRPPMQLHRLVAPSDDTPSIGSPRRPPRPVVVVGLQNYPAKYIQP